MNDQEITQTVSLLKKLQPGFLPYPIFEQVARLVVLPIIEFIPLRKYKNNIEVLLIARPKDDPFWPGLLHTPGTVIRATDLPNNPQTNWPAFDRIIKEELSNTKISQPYYVGSVFHKSKRGIEQAQLYWINVLGDSNVGKFYSVDKLPKNLIESQYTFINEAVRHFKKYKEYQ